MHAQELSFLLFPILHINSTVSLPEDNPSEIKAASHWSKPCIEVELENEDPLSAKAVKVSGENKTL